MKNGFHSESFCQGVRGTTVYGPSATFHGLSPNKHRTFFLSALSALTGIILSKDKCLGDDAGLIPLEEKYCDNWPFTRWDKTKGVCRDRNAELNFVCTSINNDSNIRKKKSFQCLLSYFFCVLQFFS